MMTQQQQRVRFSYPWDSLDFVVVEIFLEVVWFVLMIVVG
jgi:uncharacterized protein YkuJ